MLVTIKELTMAEGITYTVRAAILPRAGEWIPVRVDRRVVLIAR
jgi:hypothetical protein